MAKAVIAGASGLIGGLLLDLLLQNPAYQEVVVLTRRELSIKHPKLKQLVIDFDRLENYSGEISGHAFFCCLGSTKKKTPDLAFYRKVDHDYPLQLAQMALINGIEQYHLVSALGANAASSNFYLKMKGETEKDLKKIGLTSLQIYQPAFLDGNRTEKRFGERFALGLMKITNPFLLGSLKKYRSIQAKIVAVAMYKQSLHKQEGVFIFPSDQIKEIS